MTTELSILRLKPKPLDNNLTKSSLTKAPKANSPVKTLEQKGTKEPASKVCNKEVLKDNTKLSNNRATIAPIKQPFRKQFIAPAEYHRLLKLVQEKYPTTFPIGPSIKILAIGIHIELAEQLAIPKTLVRKFLRKYCGTRKYRETTQLGTKRYNLAGDVVGEVTEEQIKSLRHVEEFLK